MKDWIFPATGGFIFALVCALIASPVPVLDEQSYLHIAGELSFSRPYDWKLPFFPWDDAYVYAHPPLFLMWVKAGLSIFGEDPRWLKICLAFPWQFLLGFSVSFLALRFTQHSKECVALWACSPVVLMACSRGLMPDLQVTALATMSMAIYLSADRHNPVFLRLFLSGLFLGLASWTKYPALLLWVPVLLHQRRLLNIWPMFLGFFLIWGIGEFWLWFIYGEPHLWVVLRRSAEIGRGSMPGRALGIILRLCLAAPLIFLFIGKKSLRYGFPLGLILLWLADPQLSLNGFLVAAVFAVIASTALLGSFRRLSFFSVWFTVVLIGIITLHNFSAPRYLLPAIAPLSLLLFFNNRPRFFHPVLGITLLLSIFMVNAEHQFAQASVRAADRISQNRNAGYFLGEWTFRWRLEEKGWRYHRGAVDAKLALPLQSSPGEVPRGWKSIDHKKDEDCVGDGFNPFCQIRLLNVPMSVGYYAETLGFWPLGWSESPLEEASLWSP